MTFNIVFVLFPGFEELDFAGPYEVFGAAAKSVARDWKLTAVAAEREVRGANGLSVNADCLFEAAPPADVLVVPGGDTRPAMADARTIGFIKTSAGQAKWVTSVCTGSFLLSAAGVLDGRRATTHWASVGRLRERGVEAVGDERWVQDGNVISAAGVSAGIDMALYLVGQLVSPEAARQVQRYIEYDPAPPYQGIGK
jgi:transcriptional regulator GlxA family with amidase domain